MALLSGQFKKTQTQDTHAGKLKKKMQALITRSRGKWPGSWRIEGWTGAEQGDDQMDGAKLEDELEAE